MTKIIKMVANGYAIIADSYVNPRAYTLPSDAGFVSDQIKLRGDVAMVGADMRKAIEKYGKPYRSTSRK